jgi:general secretion pathway protein I
MRVKNPQGFTLIEVLVAFMILAISLVVVMQLFSGSLKAGAVSTDYFYGIFHAQEKMEEILARKELAPGSRSGHFEDGYEWTAEISHIPLETEDGRELPVSEYQIDLAVTWEKGGRERHFELVTAVLAKPPEADEESGD